MAIGLFMSADLLCLKNYDITLGAVFRLLDVNSLFFFRCDIQHSSATLAAGTTSLCSTISICHTNKYNGNQAISTCGYQWQSLPSLSTWMETLFSSMFAYQYTFFLCVKWRSFFSQIFIQYYFCIFKLPLCVTWFEYWVTM